MNLILKSKWLTNKSTIGELRLGGLFECYTLEDAIHETKIPGQTAIPAGRYEVVIDFSPKHQIEMPHLLSVPNFTGIRIHSGNTDEQTDGCILVGKTRSQDFIGESRFAYDAFFPKLRAALAYGKVWIDIVR